MAAPTTLPALLTSLTQSLSSALEVTPRIASIEHQKDGISLLDVKNELLLSYLQNLVFLILLKLRNSKSDTDGSDEDDAQLDESVRSKLIEMRLYLERGARPLEEKLRFSIDRFLRTADDAERERKAKEMGLNAANGSDSEAGSDAKDDDEVDSDAGQISHRPGKQSAAPNFGTLVDDVAGKPWKGTDDASGVYRPPKRDRQVMDAAQRQKANRRPNKSHTMDEFVESELAVAPMAEPSIGTTIVQGGRKMKTTADRKEEAERRDYEEMNFVRLPKESKKDRAQKAKQTGRSNRMMFGGEEWHNLGEGVDRIDRLTKRKAGAAGGVRAMLDKSRKRGLDTSDGPRGSGRAAEIGERFQKRVKVLEGGRRDRGKNR